MANAVWYYEGPDGEVGPVDADELRQLAAAGDLHPHTPIRKEGMRNSVEASKVKGLFDGVDLQAAARAPEPAAPAETSPIKRAARANRAASQERRQQAHDDYFDDAFGDEPQADSEAVRSIIAPIADNTTWITIMAVFLMIGGIISIISIGGILVAWVYIWLAVLLFQASGAAKTAYQNNDVLLARETTEKLALYFKIIGILLLISILLVPIMAFMFFAVFAVPIASAM